MRVHNAPGPLDHGKGSSTRENALWADVGRFCGPQPPSPAHHKRTGPSGRPSATDTALSGTQQSLGEAS